MTVPPSKVVVSSVENVVLDDGAAIVKVRTQGGGERSELEIAIASDLAPKVALALLATTAAGAADGNALAPALQAIAAGVVEASEAEKVRLQLLFDKGAVLPVEMPSDAAAALGAVLVARDENAG